MENSSKFVKIALKKVVKGLDKSSKIVYHVYGRSGKTWKACPGKGTARRNEMAICQIRTRTPTIGNEPQEAKVCGKPALENGYCMEHQRFARLDVASPMGEAPAEQEA